MISTAVEDDKGLFENYWSLTKSFTQFFIDIKNKFKSLESWDLNIVNAFLPVYKGINNFQL